MRKVVQMVSNNGVLYAAADDGTVWWWGVNGWEAAPDLPTEPSPVQRLEGKYRLAVQRYMGRMRAWYTGGEFMEYSMGAPPSDELGLDAWLAQADVEEKAWREKLEAKRK